MSRAAFTKLQPVVAVVLLCTVILATTVIIGTTLPYYMTKANKSSTRLSSHHRMIDRNCSHIEQLLEHASKQLDLQHQQYQQDQAAQAELVQQMQQQVQKLQEQVGQLQLTPLQPITKSDPIVGYYQCYSRPRAMQQVLQHWRSVYPTAPLYMVNDAGDPNLADIASRFGVLYEYDNRSSSSQNKDSYYLTEVGAMNLIVERLLSTAQSADYVILVEDDVYLLKPVDLMSLHFDINGDNLNIRLPGMIVDHINSARTAPLTDTHYGGMGGAVFRGSWLRDMQRQGVWRQHVLMLSEYATANGNIGVDQMLTALCLMSGGTLGSFPGLFEARGSNETSMQLLPLLRKEGKVEVVHKLKGFYA